MDRWKSVCFAAALVMSMTLLAHPVCAQTLQTPQAGGLPARPFRTLFGSTNASRPSRHALDLALSVNGAADDGFSAAVSTQGPTPPARFQQLYSASAQLAYVMRGSRLSASAGGSANLPYYPNAADHLNTLGYGANAGLNFASGATSAWTYGDYSYSPYYVPGLDPAGAPGSSLPLFNYTSARSPNNQVSAGASLLRRLSRRTSATLAYDFNRMWFENGDRSSRSQSAGILASRQMSRTLSLRGSYAYREGDYTTAVAAASPPTNSSHDVDLGLGYNRALPGGQAVSLDLSLGSSITSDSLSGHRIWRGSARAFRVFDGGWTAGGGISRTLRFDGVIQQPVVADIVNATVSGRFGQRVTLSLAGTYSSGLGQTRGSERFNIYSGSARAQFGLASFVAIDVQYIYYHYEFPTGYQLPKGVPVRMNRQRVQIGASFWLPLVRAGRAGAGRQPANQ